MDRSWPGKALIVSASSALKTFRASSKPVLKKILFQDTVLVSKFTLDHPISLSQSPSHWRTVSFYILEKTHSSLMKGKSKPNKKYQLRTYLGQQQNRVLQSQWDTRSRILGGICNLKPWCQASNQHRLGEVLQYILKRVLKCWRRRVERSHTSAHVFNRCSNQNHHTIAR